MDLVSIIVPIYKVEEYLDNCIKSIISQTYPNLEIILVDDGSPDKCPQKCDTWAEKDERIKVIHKENGGLSDARNAGLEIATGKYIAFVDSDDWIEKNYISYLHQACVDSGADISACLIRDVWDGKEVSEVTQSVGEVTIHTPKEAIESILEDRQFKAVAWNKLYRTEILQGERFEVGRLHEDEFFSYRIYDKVDRLVFVNVPLYNYRQRQGSIMTTFSIRHLDALDAYLRRLTLLKTKYPDLYIRDKISFCVACINFYCETITKACTDQKSAKSKIKEYRKEIKLELKDFRRYKVKQLVYLCCSSSLLIDMFSRLRIRKGHR